MIYQPQIIDPVPEGARGSRLHDVSWRGGVVLRSVNWLGDLLMTLPATWQLRQALPPGVPLYALSPAALAPVWAAAPWIDGVMAFAGHHPEAEVIAKVKERDFGLGVVMPNSFGSALDLWKCGLPRRLGRVGNLRSMLLTDRIRRWPRGKAAPRCHQLSFYLELVSALGDVAFTAECPPLRVSTDYPALLGMRRGAGWLALSPGAAFGPAKQWPPTDCAEVAKAWIAQGGRVVLLGSAKDAAAAAEVQSLLPDCLNLAGKTDLVQLMGILSAADAALANDSGAMHLAAALGTPGVGVFLSTDSVATGPLGAPWELLLADVPCRPCFQRECPLEGGRRYGCRRVISVEEAIAATLKLFPAK